MRALYLVSLDDGVQTVVDFSENHWVVHLCQMLQHLSNKDEALKRFRFVLRIVQTYTV